MQDVLSLVEQMYNNANALKLELPASLLNDVINIITQEGIPKEKEQICDAYVEGLEGLYMGAEEYYNQTYNQEETLEEWKSKFTHHCAIKTNKNK